MKKSSFKLSNEFNVDIEIGIEPVGNSFMLKPKDSIEVVMQLGVVKELDVQIHNDNGSMFISLWPENGDYEVFYNGEEVI